MANEMTGVLVKDHPDGSRDVSICYTFPISPKVVDAAGDDVIPAYDPSGIPDHFTTTAPPGKGIPQDTHLRFVGHWLGSCCANGSSLHAGGLWQPSHH